MSELTREELRQFVDAQLARFHRSRMDRVEKLTLNRVLRSKNPYLFRAKDIKTPEELIASLLDAFLSSSEEKYFGEFFEGLAVDVASKTVNGMKSSAKGIDLEFERDGIRYIVSVKSGVSWGNSSQHRQLRTDFATATRVLRQSHSIQHVQPVLGICYGKTRTTDNGLFIKHVGQSFWHFLSGDPDLYAFIMEEIDSLMLTHHNVYTGTRSRLEKEWLAQLLNDFCISETEIDWQKLIEFNSKNLPDT